MSFFQGKGFPNKLHQERVQLPNYATEGSLFSEKRADAQRLFMCNSVMNRDECGYRRAGACNCVFSVNSKGMDGLGWTNPWRVSILMVSKSRWPCILCPQLAERWCLIHSPGLWAGLLDSLTNGMCSYQGWVFRNWKFPISHLRISFEEGLSQHGISRNSLRLSCQSSCTKSQLTGSANFSLSAIPTGYHTCEGSYHGPFRPACLPGE